MQRRASPLSAVALALGLASLPAFGGDLVAYEGADMIRLTETACSNQTVLGRIDPSSREHFRSATATVDGRTYQACWGALPAAVYLIYEDGDQGVVPISKLQVPIDV